MKSNQTQNKKQLLNYLVLTGVLLGSIGAISIPSVLAQSIEDSESDIEKLYEELEAQYIAILESFGFVEPKLTETQEEELEAKLAPLEEQYEQLFANENLTAEEESKIAELDKKYDAILESYGFVFPQLTEAQEQELEEKLAPLEEKFLELEGLYGDEEFFDSELTPEQEAQLAALDEQYDAILQEFGFHFPELTEEQERELEAKLAPLDEEYEKICIEFEEKLKELEEVHEKQLEELDAKYSSIHAEFGFIEPKLTEAQEQELEERLAPLEEQYDEIFGEFEQDGHESHDHDSHEHESDEIEFTDMEFDDEFYDMEFDDEFDDMEFDEEWDFDSDEFEY